MEDKKVLSVSDLTAIVQKAIANRPELAGLWVRGEISNFKKHTSGHFYFSLKDEKSSIRAVMFRGRAQTVGFLPENGMDCLVRGYVSLYPRDTMVQLYAEEIIPAGTGLQQIMLEELKKKLQQKGYFAAERKRALPLLPMGVGVVTSPTGAAIRDIHNVISRRYPGMPILLYPALVQGEKAAQVLAQGIEHLGQRDEIEVVVLARGGGSAEDLNAFNAEIVADAVFNCPKPVISAVGHEIDYTIADLVADVRAATPSAAGELAVPVKFELLEQLEKYRERMRNAQAGRLQRESMKLELLESSGVMKKPERWLAVLQEDVARKENDLFELMAKLYVKKREKMKLMAARLQALSPLATLARGYSICMGDNGKVIVDVASVAVDEKVSVKLYKGKLDCLILGKEDEDEKTGSIL